VGRDASSGHADDLRRPRVRVRGAVVKAQCTLGAYRELGRRDCRGVGRGLVDDQVAHGPGLRVDDAAVLVGVRRLARRTEWTSVLGVPEFRGREPRERLVGRGERLAPREQVVAGAVHGPQAVRAQPVRDLVGTGAYQGSTGVRRRVGGRVPLRDLDLLEDEREVTGGHAEAAAHRADRSVGRRHSGDLADQRDRDRQSAGHGYPPADPPTSRPALGVPRQLRSPRNRFRGCGFPMNQSHGAPT